MTCEATHPDLGLRCEAEGVHGAHRARRGIETISWANDEWRPTPSSAPSPQRRVTHRRLNQVATAIRGMLARPLASDLDQEQS